MLDAISIVHVEETENETSQTFWFWDRSEAEDVYDRVADRENTTVTLYSASVTGVIQDFVDEAIGNGAEGLNEVRSNRPGPEPLGSWTELEYRPEGYFYIERLVSPDYWPYRVEAIEDTNGFVVIDHTSDQHIATVESDGQGTAFLVTVNDQKWGTLFTNLKAAVIFAAEEYNGV